MRKRIVATTEGGAITGEERLREFTDTLYGAILSYDGAPTAYQVERIGVLESDLASINAEFDALLDKDLPALNKALKSGGLPEVEAPPASAAVADSGLRFGRLARWRRRRGRRLPEPAVVDGGLPLTAHAADAAFQRYPLGTQPSGRGRLAAWNHGPAFRLPDGRFSRVRGSRSGEPGHDAAGAGCDQRYSWPAT